jgi:hypothetical protein
MWPSLFLNPAHGYFARMLTCAKRGVQVIDVRTAEADGHWDYADIKRLIEYRDRLKAALRAVLQAEWMVTCDWTSRDKRDEILDPAWALLPDLPAQSETKAEQVKCLHPLHHGWHDRKGDCVEPLARSEFSDYQADREGEP